MSPRHFLSLTPPRTNGLSPRYSANGMSSRHVSMGCLPDTGHGSMRSCSIKHSNSKLSKSMRSETVYGGMRPCTSPVRWHAPTAVYVGMRRLHKARSTLNTFPYPHPPSLLSTPPCIHRAVCPLPPHVEPCIHDPRLLPSKVPLHPPTPPSPAFCRRSPRSRVTYPLPSTYLVSEFPVSYKLPFTPHSLLTTIACPRDIFLSTSQSISFLIPSPMYHLLLHGLLHFSFRVFLCVTQRRDQTD